MILHMPWSKELGGPRTSVELADEFRRAGHVVDKYDINDAVPKSGKLASYFRMSLFVRRAIRYVQEHGARYEVIQAEQGNLPCSKNRLKFHGLLIARSNGLVHLHAQRERAIDRERRLLKRRQGSFGGNIMRWLAARTWGLAEVDRSFEAADAIFLINHDELDFVADRLGHREKAFLFHNGLSEARFAEFAAHRTAPAQRLASQQVVFIGSWAELKGSYEFPGIVRAVRAEVPAARFLFLGTGVPREVVLQEFHPEDRAACEVTATYPSPDLPSLLAHATAGVFPSYMEGFGLGVLEKLAAGIPTVAWDVPGAREMLKQCRRVSLTPAGDEAALAQSVVGILRMSLEEYSAASDEAVQIASRFRWSEIAPKMLAVYQGLLERQQVASAGAPATA